jgi:protein-disulfide isomerase
MSKQSAARSKSERAAAVRRAHQAAERRRNLYVVGAIVAVILVIVGIGLLVQSQRDTTGEAAVDPTGVTSDYGVVVGDADAPKTITVYEDFQCPVCRALEQATAEQVRSGVEDGNVKLEYRIVSFLDNASRNEYSSRAANAAMVVLDRSGRDVFWKFHDLLFANQPEEGTAGPDNDQLIAFAVEAGADPDEVTDGIKNGEFDQLVINATDEMSKNGVTGTPTVLIDGEVAGKTPAEAVQAVLGAVK